ncbi:MAG: SDR family oxidoreductase [Woeseia sp.]
MICVTGYNTTIFWQLEKMLPAREKVFRIGRDDAANHQVDLATFDSEKLCSGVPLDAERYLFCAGVLFPKRINEQTAEEIFESLAVNMVSLIRLCEHVLEKNDRARIVIVGSESGFKGSYDTTYFLAKAAVHEYVRQRKIRSPQQQLVLLAPSAIEDSGMTQRREDLKATLDQENLLPKQRLLTAREVARAIYFLLYQDDGYISNAVIEMNGGKFALMG